MENPEEILHSLEEFAKMKPKDIPRELEEYLKFVAKTGDPVYQWSLIKSLFREKLINVITEFYESCTNIEIPTCPNVDMFNYDLMKTFILEKLDTFASAPFTIQRICELLTSPRKEYTRVDKYMRALEKNILVVSTTEPGGRRTENGEGILNGIESDHELNVPEVANEINVEEMDDSPYIETNNHHLSAAAAAAAAAERESKTSCTLQVESIGDGEDEWKMVSEASTSNQEIVCVQYVSIEPVLETDDGQEIEETQEENISVTITAINVTDDDQIIKTEINEAEQQETTTTTTTTTTIKLEEDSCEKTDDEISPIIIEAEISSDMPKSPSVVENSTVISEVSSSSSSTSVTENLLDEVSTARSERLSESDSISPEGSITSSENSSSATETSSNCTETSSRNVSPEASDKDEFEDQNETISVTIIDSSTNNNASGDIVVDSQQDPELIMREVEIVEVSSEKTDDESIVPNKSQLIVETLKNNDDELEVVTSQTIDVESTTDHHQNAEENSPVILTSTDADTDEAVASIMEVDDDEVIEDSSDVVNNETPSSTDAELECSMDATNV